VANVDLTVSKQFAVVPFFEVNLRQKASPKVGSDASIPAFGSVEVVLNICMVRCRHGSLVTLQ